MSTDPMPDFKQPDDGWIGIGRTPLSHAGGKRLSDPNSDIEMFGGTRSHCTKEPGPARVVQQWKEGLRKIVPEP